MVCPPFASRSFIEEYGVVSGHDDKQLRVILGIYVNLFSLYLSYYSVYVSTISFSINFGTSRNHVCDCSFITCQNFIFGKYVRLTVCYLPKFHFWQVCSFNGLSVCLSVCVSVRNAITHERFEISSPNGIISCNLDLR